MTTIICGDLDAAVSSVPMDRRAAGGEIIVDHEHVVEKVMADHTVLPVRFHTIASNAEAVRSLLRSRYSGLKGLLGKVDSVLRGRPDGPVSTQEDKTPWRTRGGGDGRPDQGRGTSQGLYVYCVMDSGDARNFGPIGVGGRRDPVTTIAYRDLGAVVSSVPMDRHAVGGEIMLDHERVVEKVMADHTVLPLRFYTVAPDAEAVRSLLRSRYPEFNLLLRNLDGKVELGLKALWKDMNQVLSETMEDVSSLPSHQGSPGKEELMQDARVVLEGRKAKLTELLLEPLKPLTKDLRLNRTYGDDMIVNAAFLTDRTREREFDARLEELAAVHSDSIEFKYVGPAPPYSFVTIVIKEEPG